MTMEPDTQGARRVHLPLVESTPITEDPIEAELRAWEEAERERLGLRGARKQWADTMLNPTVRKSEKESITILISGLTAAQDFFVEGALRGLGYTVTNIGMADAKAFQTGKEFGNRGQCNPTYFTVGALVQHLIELRDVHGIPAADVVKNYVFLTAGACGPCRFGMYVTEYRKALRDAGFEGFRVMLFQQQGGLSQATGDDVGLAFNPTFFIAVIKAVVCGDVVNALAYRIRPYEVAVGDTDRAMEEARKIIYASLYEKTNIFVALHRARKVVARVKVDRMKARAKSSIIGEFWAMTTEGDGNYQLQRFLEKEGGECDIQLTTAWLLYNIWEVARDSRERQHLRHADDGQYGTRHDLEGFDLAKRMATLRLAEIGLRVGFQAFAIPAGLYGYHLPDMDAVAEVAHGYYSNDLRGGEGHMEVGKLILNVVNHKAHITVSVKPFGCMPSSGVSDGVQTLITARYPGTIYCPVETAGDGATNFYSRVQMYMFKARLAADEELARTLASYNLTEDQVRDFLVKHPRFNHPLHHPPHRAAGTAANIVHEVAPYLTQTRAQRAMGAATRAAATVRDAVTAVPGIVDKVVTTARDEGFRAQVRADAELVADLVRGKAKERFGPLVERLAKRAFFDREEPVTHHAPTAMA